MKWEKVHGRSIPGFDLHEALMKCNTYLERFGGHSMAVGVSLKKENFEKFREEFEKYAQNSNICDIIPIIVRNNYLFLTAFILDQNTNLSRYHCSVKVAKE